MKWFRFYHASYRNPKVQEMRPELFRFWVNMLCVASESEERGTIPSEAHLGRALGLSKALVKRYCSDLEALVLLHRSDTGALTPHDWHALQPDSDDAAKRKRDERARAYEKQQSEMSRDMSRDKNVTVTCKTQIQNERETENGVCVAHAREGDDLRDWREAIAELQGDDASKLIAAMLQDSAEVPSVSGLEAWRFIHAAHVMRGQEAKTWNFFMAVARRASRREFDAWHDPAPREQANGTGGPSNGVYETAAQAKRRRLDEWARSE